MPEKTLARVEGVHIDSGLTLTGYEIHHGQTDFTGARLVVKRSDGEPIGAGSEDGAVWGTYMHGLFNQDKFRRWFIDRLRVKKGMSPKNKILFRYDLEEAFDRLAGVVRESVDIEKLYEVMGLK